MEIDIEKYLFKGASFLELLTFKEKEYIAGQLVRKEYKKGQPLFKEGFSSKGVYILRKGKVKLFQINKNGRDNVVYIYKKGDYFGYRPLLCEEPHPASATAIDNVVVLFIPETVFLELLKKSNVLARQLLVNLAHEFSVWINKLTLFSQYSVKERVALSLLILSADSAVVRLSSKKLPTISLNRDDLSGFVGTTTETLVRMLRVLKDEKIISTRGTKIIILKRSKLFDMISNF
jgi:CRP-like cAMP-binding protein